MRRAGVPRFGKGDPGNRSRLSAGILSHLQPRRLLWTDFKAGSACGRFGPGKRDLLLAWG